MPIDASVLEKLSLPHTLPVTSWEWHSDSSLKYLEKKELGRLSALLRLIASNGWQRLIQLSVALSPSLLGTMDRYLQLCGLTWRLLPVETDSYELSIDLPRI